MCMCKAIYTQTKSRVGKKREVDICKKVCSGRDCNEAEINERVGSFTVRTYAVTD
jgi:hypothetical protein